MLELQNDRYLATLTPPAKSKWRLQCRDCIYFSILTTYKLHISASIAYSYTIVTVFPLFGGQQLSGTIVHCARYKGSPEIEDGGLQPEVLISLLVDKMGTRFQRQNRCCWALAIKRNY